MEQEIRDSYRRRRLTRRERQVAALVGAAKPNKVIAHELGLTPETVKTYLCRIFAKTECDNRTELALKVMEHPEIVALEESK